jgi:hypothetical protein
MGPDNNMSHDASHPLLVDASPARHGRPLELVAVLALLAFGLIMPTPNNHRAMPTLAVRLPPGGDLVMLPDPALSFPVKLGNIWCSKDQLLNTSLACMAHKAAGTRAYEQVPVFWTAILLCVFLPIFVLLAHHFMMAAPAVPGPSPGPGPGPSHAAAAAATATTTYPFGRKLLPMRDGFLGGMLSLAVAIFVTNLFKHAVGRPRPNFDALMALDAEHYGKEAWRGFPSGHSSTAMAGLHFLSLWLLHFVAKVAAAGGPSGFFFRGRLAVGPLLSGLTRLVLRCAAATPTLLAMWVAVTRVEDFWHNYSDILAGGLIGYVSAHFGFNYCASHAETAGGHRYVAPELAAPDDVAVEVEMGTITTAGNLTEGNQQ